MTTTTLTQEIKSRQLRLRIEPRIDELEDIDSKICAMLMKTPDCLKDFSQPIIDTNPDYLNPLRLKDNSSRINVFNHIEEAELLAENNSNYIMQPLPSVESISWTLKPHIPIESYELTPKVNLETHSLESIENSLFPPLPPFVTSKNEECYKHLPPIQEEMDKEFSFENLFPLSNVASRDLSGITPDVATNENKTDGVNFEHAEVNICPKYPENEDEIGALDFGVITDENKNEELDAIPKTQSEDDRLDMFSRNSLYGKESDEFYRRVGVLEENYKSSSTDDEKINLKFQYASFISDNWENEIRQNTDCIILVCKECGFEEYT